MARDRFAGTVLVARGDEPVFVKAYGLASRRFNVPNRVDTRFNLGSMNKMFTAVAIARLAEQGRLDYQDLVARHVPDYPNRAVAESVRIHHLLTHTSGLGSYWNDEYEARWARLRTVEDFLSLFVDESLAFDPGSRFQYSNAGFILLGHVIERLTGQPYDEHVRENIFEPAGMFDTDAFAVDRPVPNVAIGYTRLGEDGRGDDGPLRNNLFLHPVKGGPAGGGYSTAGDLLRFSMALVEHRLVGPETLRVLMTGKVDAGPLTHYAYGFGVETVNGREAIGHGGGSTGYQRRIPLFSRKRLYHGRAVELRTGRLTSGAAF